MSFKGLSTICPSFSVFLKSIILWLEEPLNINAISFLSSSKRPSTKTSIKLRSSFVTSQLALEVPNISLSKIKPEKAHIVFLGSSSLTLFKKESNPLWFSGSKGSPPKIVRPSM